MLLRKTFSAILAPAILALLVFLLATAPQEKYKFEVAATRTASGKDEGFTAALQQTGQIALLQDVPSLQLLSTAAALHTTLTQSKLVLRSPTRRCIKARGP
ncbi:hypothetical protein [Pontibacter akesuensis]|uniref:hypothetical protein n=1 Tax=Pontibacter akesuensis TaxID=388950 RepID=UPI00083B4A26|nr:hypothetical protein [Pontibacter akesuensis]